MSVGTRDEMAAGWRRCRRRAGRRGRHGDGDDEYVNWTNLGRQRAMSRETKTAGAAEIAGRMAGFVWSHQPAGTPVAAAADAARRYNDEFEPAAGNGATLYYVFEDGFLQTALYMVNSGSPLVARIDKDSRKES